MKQDQAVVNVYPLVENVMAMACIQTEEGTVKALPSSLCLSTYGAPRGSGVLCISFAVGPFLSFLVASALSFGIVSFSKLHYTNQLSGMQSSLLALPTSFSRAMAEECVARVKGAVKITLQ